MQPRSRRPRRLREPSAGPPKEGEVPLGGTARSAREDSSLLPIRGDIVAMLRLRLAPLAPAVLEIRDDSAAHAGHPGAAGGGGHFSLVIVSKTFSGVSRLERHQRVLREVADLVPHPIHALSIKALAPEEFPSQP